MQALPIPDTTPSHYISFKHALNLRYPTEDTGEWHFWTAFFGDPERSRSIPLAGDGEKINTNSSLGDKGIREMSDVLVAQKILPSPRPVYVATHYRAIADIAMLHLIKNERPTIATVRAINQWLDTEEQVDRLLGEYLSPLRNQLPLEAKETFEQWIKTVHYE